MRPFTFVIALCIAVGGCSTRPPDSLDVGELAPAFELVEVANQRSFAATTLKGSVVVLNFWSISCTNCLKEIDELKTIHDQGRAKVVSIVIDSDVQQVRSVIGDMSINYPVLLGHEDVFVRYDGFSLPYTLVLDSTSTVRKKIFGQIELTELRAFIDAAANLDLAP